MVGKAGESWGEFQGSTSARRGHVSGGVGRGAHSPTEDSSETLVLSVLRALGNKGVRKLVLEEPFLGSLALDAVSRRKST